MHGIDKFILADNKKSDKRLKETEKETELESLAYPHAKLASRRYFYIY